MLVGSLFRAESALLVVGTLKGDQVPRAVPACLGGDTRPEILILEESTNHLGLDSVHAVEAALAAFEGALLFFSHDTPFLREIGIERRIVEAS